MIYTEKMIADMAENSAWDIIDKWFESMHKDVYDEYDERLKEHSSEEVGMWLMNNHKDIYDFMIKHYKILFKSFYVINANLVGTECKKEES